MAELDLNTDDFPEGQDLLEEVEHIFSFSGRRECEVLSQFGEGSSIATGVNARYEEAPKKLIFNEEDLKNLCIRFRLRFLPSEFYCGEVPYEVISKIKHFEHQQHGNTKKLFILARPSFFLLRNVYDDPLLFVERASGSFELLCRWGNKTPWYTPILKYPYRDFKSMVISSLAVGTVIAIICSFMGMLNYPNMFKSIIMKIPILILSAGMFSTLALCYGLLTKTDFSADNWRSKYFPKRII